MNGVYAWKRNRKAWSLQPRYQKYSEQELDAETLFQRWPGLDNVQLRSVTSGAGFEAGLREDGVLCAWSSVQHPGSVSKIVQVNKDQDWATVAGNFYFGLIALKRDGSLWRIKNWEISFPEKAEPVLEVLQQPPVRLSTHKDWLAIGNLMNGVVSLAADGSLWYWSNGVVNSLSDQPMLAVSRRPSKIENILGN